MAEDLEAIDEEEAEDFENSQFGSGCKSQKKKAKNMRFDIKNITETPKKHSVKVPTTNAIDFCL